VLFVTKPADEDENEAVARMNIDNYFFRCAIIKTSQCWSKSKQPFFSFKPVEDVLEIE